MIDLHTHILPAIDDGSQSLDESLAMARLAVADGITVMVATPHVAGSPFAVTAARRDAALELLRSALREQGIPLAIVPGMECWIHEQTIAAALADPGCFLGGAGNRHLLVELPNQLEVSHLEALLFDAQLKGLRLVLAHPERHRDLCADFDRLARLVERGLILQVNAGSLTGELGWSTSRLAKKLVCTGLVQVVASDTHDPVERPPRLSKALKKLEKWLGPATARQLVYDNPARLIGWPL